MKNKGITFIIIGITVLILASGFGVEWSIELETGNQNYKRSMFGLEIPFISQYGYKECNNWKNPMPGEKGTKVLAYCGSIFRCALNEFKSSLYNQGCSA